MSPLFLQNTLSLTIIYSQPGDEPRAFLLPLLAQPHSSPLSHFVSYFVPLSERMFDLQQKAETEGRQSEAKVWSVLVGQVWAGLAGYCTGTADLKEVCHVSFSKGYINPFSSLWAPNSPNCCRSFCTAYRICERQS